VKSETLTLDHKFIDIGFVIMNLEYCRLTVWDPSLLTSLIHDVEQT